MQIEKGLINTIEIIENVINQLENIIASGDCEKSDRENLKKCKSAIKYLNKKRYETNRINNKTSD